VDYCTELEFIETWDLGSIEENDWKSGGPNWSVTGNTGNPPPVVVFNWDPVQTDYENSLESYPLCAVGLTEGSIWLDFDLALNSVLSTGQELLLVQVWGWDTQEWFTVSEYSNLIGNYGWTPQRIDIGSLALDKIFKIRFTARGANSLDIRGWFIDNIHVYRTCPAPENVAIDPDYYDGIRLIWDFPENDKTGTENGTRELSGYLVYRSVNGGNYELLTPDYTSLPYVDPDTNLVMGSMYCYKVSAVYISPTDQCESALSNEVCVLWTGIGEEENNPGNIIDLYPNPAKDHLFIHSSEEIIKITLCNALGIIFHDEKIRSNHIELNTADYPSGTYIIHFETHSGMTSRIITIQR
jgi:hypothetical protein